MRSALSILTLGAAVLFLAAPAAEAMGFGRTFTATTLGQPLDFFATVALDTDETISRECVSAEVHVGDARLPAPAVRVTLEPQGVGSSRRVRVTTATMIDEPVVTVEVTLGCTSRISRRFVTFVDPPSVRLAESGVPLAPQQQMRDSQAMPILEAARNASKAVGSMADVRNSSIDEPRVKTSAGRASKAVRVSVAAPAGPSAARPPARERTPRHALQRRGAAAPAFAAAPARGAPRLQLEAPAPVAAASAPRTVVAAAATIAKASLPTAAPASSPASLAAESVGAASAARAAVASPGIADDAAALARELERIRVLEAGLAQLRADSAATQSSLVTLQARLREAESGRYANGLVYALVVGVLFFAVLAAALWALRPLQRRRARWFDAAANQQARVARNPERGTAMAARTPAPERDSASLALQDTPSWSGVPSVLNNHPATIGGLEVTTVLGPEFSRALAVSAAANSVGQAAPAGAWRSLAAPIEELIDLEQQVEFFVVLGQDEAAIDLLESHLAHAEAASPWPYLRLLDIHRRRGDEAADEQVRSGFSARFGVAAPQWPDDLHAGRSIDAYPQTLARLHSLWHTPLHAMQTLDDLLFHRSSNNEIYDFAAYSELLFLYGVARELAGHVETDSGSIDLFLPLDDATATAPGGDPAERVYAVDLDVSDWMPDEADAPLVIRRSPGRHGAG